MDASPRIALDHFVPFRLNRLAAEVSRALGRVYGERFGIDIPEWRVIATLGDQERARAQDIAVSTRMHKSMVSRAVNRLMELGWVARSANAKDRREAPLRLTETGQEVYQQLVPIVLDYQDRLLEDLSAGERRMLDRLLDKLEQRLDLPCRPKDRRPPAASTSNRTSALPDAASR